MITIPKTGVVLVVIIVMVMLHVDEAACKRKRLCRMKQKKTKCVDIVPRRMARKFKHCPPPSIATLGRCAKVGGYCEMTDTANGRKICECVEPDRAIGDQQWSRG